MDLNWIIFAIIGGIFVIWNIAVFILYAMDKNKAEKGKWRIKESTLIGCSFLMGGIGSILAMQLLRHKTQNTKFKVFVPIGLIVNIIIIALAVLALFLFTDIFSF